tara:strand:- start:12544 stop:13071 length:528 start_codon:yes stop_codon:yes gene_type:complete
MTNNNLIHLGMCNKPHGIKGGFQFKLFNTDNSVLSNKCEVTLRPRDKKSNLPEDGKIYSIRNIHFGNKTICYLEGIDERNQVEELLPFDIFFPRELFPEAAEDEIYVTDLIGLTVVNEAEEHLGEVTAQYDNGVQTILKMRLKNKTIELPYVSAFFPKVDLQKKMIVLIEPEVMD